MACTLHKQTACVRCARAALSAQVARLYPPAKPGAAASLPEFKGRDFRAALREKGIN